MGMLISTGIDNNGHKFDFVYTDKADGTRQCLMVCSCGWSDEMTSKGPWAVVESGSRSRRHLRDVGVPVDERPAE
jgi:hypothetical protein